jgi:hypothetical protein
MDPSNCRETSLEAERAMETLNVTLGREKLQAFIDSNGQCHVRSAVGSSAVVDLQTRAFSAKDREMRQKKGKLDSAGKSKPCNENITEALNQIRMALKDPILDPEVNRKVLIDHVYLVASGEITKAARKLLIEQLGNEQRRQVIFMDRSELLDLLVITNLTIPMDADPDFGF